ncbi:XylR N-terminal domain-containing protein [Siminovitchia sediminis]|uniref:XylR N-terminal domain-containing protein n=1 Tax=Siminovitchia sediminis TaxID=1274353 RepID=A0ABW4KP14_9BACI
MKAQELSLSHLITTQEKSGVKLKDLQLTFNSTDAWGLLRKDLTSALGISRAKRFLMRYGWNCGVHEARILKKVIDWEDDVEWLIAGSKVHHLTGRVLSYPENFQVDMEKGQFNVSGYWIDSYEAKQHLTYSGKYHEPVCYYLIGYASGYTTECMGKKVIFKEVKCKAKGDDHCSYIGKTVDEWGDDISEELFYYEDTDMAVELDHMYKRIEQQKEKLKIGYTLSQNLTQDMLQGKGLPGFAETIGKTLHCPVLIEGRHYEKLASYGDIPGIHTYMSVTNIRERLNDLTGNSFIEWSLKDKTFKFLTTPILIKSKIFGYITIVIDHESDEFYKDLLERAAIISALHMQNERVAIETEQRLKGELLEQLLNNKSIDRNEIYDRFSYLDYNLSTEHYVMYVVIEEEVNSKEIEDYAYLNIRNKISEYIYQDFLYEEYEPLLLPKLNSIQAIIDKHSIDNRYKSPKHFAEQLIKKLGFTNVYIGLSDQTKDISDFYKKFQEVKRAVELAIWKKAENKVVLSNELGHLTLFLSARDPEELEAFANENLRSLIEYDKKRNSELLHTLMQYSQNEFNLHKTAREMCISISGMRYRVQKIEELLDTDLSDSNSRFQVQLSLQILLLLGNVDHLTTA